MMIFSLVEEARPPCDLDDSLELKPHPRDCAKYFEVSKTHLTLKVRTVIVIFIILKSNHLPSAVRGGHPGTGAC